MVIFEKVILKKLSNSKLDLKKIIKLEINFKINFEPLKSNPKWTPNLFGLFFFLTSKSRLKYLFKKSKLFPKNMYRNVYGINRKTKRAFIDFKTRKKMIVFIKQKGAGGVGGVGHLSLFILSIIFTL